jgi:outer membrane beta-barrel protein
MRTPPVFLGRFFTLLFIGAASFGGSSLVLAKDKSDKDKDKDKEETPYEESDKLPAVQNRLYRVQHEFDVGLGVLPVDAFYKGVSLTGSYTYHLNDIWGIEARGSYLKPMLIKTSLRDKLEKGFGEPPTKFAEIPYYFELGALFKPIYGKLSFLNRTLAYGELYLSLQAVMARFEGGTATDEEPQGKAPRWGFGGAPGFGIRGFLTPYLSLRFDFRYNILYSREEMHYPLALMLSLGITTRSDL